VEPRIFHKKSSFGSTESRPTVKAGRISTLKKGTRARDGTRMAAKRLKMLRAAKPQPKELNRGFHGFHG
jgi:hypothetical protein